MLFGKYQVNLFLNYSNGNLRIHVAAFQICNPAVLKPVLNWTFCFSGYTNALIGPGRFGPLEKSEWNCKIAKNVKTEYIPIKNFPNCSQESIKVIENNTI